MATFDDGLLFLDEVASLLILCGPHCWSLDRERVHSGMERTSQKDRPETLEKETTEKVMELNAVVVG
jgi:hypothetical protein